MTGGRVPRSPCTDRLDTTTKLMNSHDDHTIHHEIFYFEFRVEHASVGSSFSCILMGEVLEYRLVGMLRDGASRDYETSTYEITHELSSTRRLEHPPALVAEAYPSHEELIPHGIHQ